MTASKLVLPTIIRDSREKPGHGWIFSKMIEKKLDTGDYTLEGFEEILTIDRKATTAEFAQNINEKRFDNELERLRKFKYGFIVCEFDYADLEMYPHGSGIPKFLWAKLKVKAPFLKKKFAEYQTSGVNVILAGKFGKEVATTIFKEVYIREVQ